MTQNKFPVIGVTGITGSGASTVAGFLEEFGGKVISADRLAHEAQKKGQPAYDGIVALFGGEILQEDGEINRKALGKIVFGDKSKLKQLEEIVHPVVVRHIKNLVDKCDKTFAVIDAPLLIESGLYTGCDEVWLVCTAHEERLARIMKRDGIDMTAAQMRLESRLSDNELAKKADFILYNQNDLTVLKEKVYRRIKMGKPKTGRDFREKDAGSC